MRTATYIKAMALRGQIVNVDIESANALLVAVSRIGNNVNQIAHKVNIIGKVTQEEFNALMKWRDELRHMLKAYLSTIRSEVA